MANMTGFDPQHYAQLLGNKTMDASGGVLLSSGARIEPDDANRTILIGLGGTGMKTIDYVKGVISKRLEDNWTQYVGFLGIDTDLNELKASKFIQNSEFVNMTRNGIEIRVMDEKQFPLAWQPFAEIKATSEIKDPNGHGAGKKRLTSKLKIHDKAPGDPMGVDETIVSKLVELKNKLAAPAVDAMHTSTYEVYVVGSIGGGTGAGTFQEMPALIREALGIANVNIYAIIFLPDTVSGLDPAAKSRMEANGYAALKEINYFEGMSMRRGYDEKWTYNLAAQPELPRDINRTSSFYKIPYLMGTLTGPSPTSDAEARAVVAEFLINTLGKTVFTTGQPMAMDSFYNNAAQFVKDKSKQPGVPDLEAAGSAHEFPRHFAALGFTQASAPQKIVQSYAVSRLCAESGLKTVDAAARAAKVAAGQQVVVPFRAADDYLTSTEGTKTAAEMMKKFTAEVCRLVRNSNFTIAANCGGFEINWDSIRDNQAEVAVLNAAKRFKEDKTGTSTMAELDKALGVAVKAFMDEVRHYVELEGPLAFVNLYNGRFVPVDGESGTGLSKMIQYLVEGKDHTGKDLPFVTPDIARTALDQSKTAVANFKKGFIKGMFSASEKESLCNKWRQDYERFINSEVVAENCKHVFGTGKTLQTGFAAPIRILTDNLEAFGYILDSMCDLYGSFGQQMKDYNTFAEARDDSVSSNIAALHTSSYQWLKDEADKTVKAVNAREFRDALVADFFADSGKWLDVPEGLVSVTGGVASLLQNDRPVPAREHFDSIVAEKLPANVIGVDSIVEQLVTNGSMDYNSVASKIISDLVSNGRPRIRASLPGGPEVYRMIKYPQSLNNTPNGQQFVAALKEAAATQGITENQIYESASDSNIVLYYFVAPFEVYQLTDLPTWQASYENELMDNINVRLLHSRAPHAAVSVDADGVRKYTDRLQWKDHPPIALPTRDERLPDPQTGIISREGKFLNELDALIAEAKASGVLYSVQENGNWMIRRVHCDKTVDWKLQLELMAPDASGFLPTGRELAGAVASQNGRTLEQISRDVKLSEGGLMEGPWNNEAAAWKFAARILRAHVPMYLEVKETVAKFCDWAKVIEKYNEEVRNRLKPAMMVYLIKGRVLSKDENGVWKVRVNGTDKVVANLSEATVNMLATIAPTDAKIIRGGCSAYYLYNKLIAMPEMAGDGIHKSFAYAKERLMGWLNESDFTAIQAGADMAAFADAERAAIDAMGAKLEEAAEDKPLPERFVDAMKAMGILDPAVMKDIRDFYYKTSLWERL